MKTSHRKMICLLVIMALIFVTVLFVFINQRQKVARDQKQSVTAGSETNRQSSDILAIEENSEQQQLQEFTSLPKEALDNGEVLSTRNMYAAHAPLRIPEIAHPDSEANRMILQTMVQKALLHQAQTAANSPNN